MNAGTWTEAHRREARARMHELAAERERAGQVLSTAWSMHDERALRAWLCAASGLDAARSDREVRRVRALAEGRLVRVTTWRGQSGEEYATYAEADADKSHGGGRLTRITRIRRAR